MSRVVVVGAGVGGLAAAVRCAEAGHQVRVLEAARAAGGKAGVLERDGFTWDTGPSLVTMPWVFTDLLGDAVELVRVEPLTRYRFADGSSVDLSADLPRAIDSLEAWSPGAGHDWAAYLGACAQMWRASLPVLTGPPPWPPTRDAARPDPRALLAVKPWHTLRTLARSHARDPRLRLIIERAATYAGADPRRAPAALALAGYVEHAFGGWHVRGGIHAIVRALMARLDEAGGSVEFDTRVEGLIRGERYATGVRTAAGDEVPGDWVLWNGDAAALEPDARAAGAERSLSGYVLMLGVRGRTPDLTHHTILFPGDYTAEFDDVFVRRRAVREPTLYLSVSSHTDPTQAPPDCENWFVLANAPAGVADSVFDGYDDVILERLDRCGIDPSGRIEVRARRTPGDLERETGAVGGAIYGAAPHGRLGTLRRPGPRVRGLPNVLRVGGTAHPGGGLPLVALSGAMAARIVGPA